MGLLLYTPKTALKPALLLALSPGFACPKTHAVRLLKVDHGSLIPSANWKVFWKSFSGRKSSNMGKKKSNAGYNDFLDGEKLRDNDSIKSTLQSASAQDQDTSPPPTQLDTRGNGRERKATGGVKQPQLTHFLCFPLVNSKSRPQLQEAIRAFSVELEKGRVIPPQSIRPTGTLHLTLGVMSLDAARLEDAKIYLQELDLKSLLFDALKPQQDASAAGALGQTANIPARDPHDFLPLSIGLNALLPMHQPQKTSVLYAEPKDASGRLYPFAVALKNRFTEEGFIVDQNRALILHATVVNSVYAKSGGRGSHAKGPIRFDATCLIEKHRDFVWADSVAIDRVQICKMGARKIKDNDGNIVDEEYEVVAERLI